MIELDDRLRPKLVNLAPDLLERLVMSFLRAMPVLTIARDGVAVTGRVIEASRYASKSGMKQDGIDVRATVEGGEEWAFQCKRVGKWGQTQVKAAIKEATYSAQHFFLVVTGDPTKEAWDEIKRHPRWTMWGLEELCDELRRLPSALLTECLSGVLSPEDLRKFVPLASGAFVSADQFFGKRLEKEAVFNHDWKLVGREKELAAVLEFASDPNKKGLLLTSKGGDGKSRLLLAVAREFEQLTHGQAIFYNPHRDPQLDPLEEGLTNLRQPALLVIDDAHRSEDIPERLLHLAGRQEGLHVILAARPQGLAELIRLLNKEGIDESLREQIRLLALKGNAIRPLAEQALLGTSLAVDELLRFTRDSAFLTTITGSLLRKGLMKWEEWASHKDFRKRVFDCFEHDNLSVFPSKDAPRSYKRMLRFVAMLAPIPNGRPFQETAAEILQQTEDDVAERLQTLKRADVILEGPRGLRVIPDLFADFLVLETAYEDDHGPSPLGRRMLENGKLITPALVRNLSEVGWILGKGEEAALKILRPILDGEKEVFRKVSFYERSEELKSWQTFCVFLPSAALDLARIALDERTAPEYQPAPGQGHRYFGEMDSRQYVHERLSPILSEIAKHNLDYQACALGMLWELCVQYPATWIDSIKSHSPLKALASVLDSPLGDPPDASISALGWLKKRVQQKSSLEDLKSNAPMLSALMKPCFVWRAERARMEDQDTVLRYGLFPVTQIRKRHGLAFEIARLVIELGDWATALLAIQALEPAIIGPKNWTWPPMKNNPDPLVVEASTEALAVVELAIERHSHIAVRLQANRTLVRAAYRTHHQQIRTHIQAALSKIPSDLETQVGVALISDGYWDAPHQGAEFSANSSESRFEAARARWNGMLRNLACQLAESHPEASALAQCLFVLEKKLAGTSMKPLFSQVFVALAEAASGLALDLARYLIKLPDTSLAAEWTALGIATAMTDPAMMEPLLLLALAGLASNARMDAVRTVMRLAKKNGIGGTLKEAVAKASINFRADETKVFLEGMQWLHERYFTWAWQIAVALPAEHARSQGEAYLSALTPLGRPELIAPSDVVAKAFSMIEALPVIPCFSQEQGFLLLAQVRPRAVFDFLCTRLNHAARIPGESSYQPLPGDLLDDDDDFVISSLADEQDFPAICDMLWKMATMAALPWEAQTGWQKLFRWIVLPHENFWKAKWLDYVEKSASAKALSDCIYLLKSPGALSYFQRPELAKAVLVKAEEFSECDITEFYWKLRLASGPAAQSYTNGELMPEDDYVEAASRLAAKEHAGDAVLGPFYRWIAELEADDKRQSRVDFAQRSAAWEAECDE